MRVFSDYFLGFLLISIGIILLLRYFFNLNIPVFKTVIGLIFVYFGISMIFGGHSFKNNTNIIFNSGTIKNSNIQKEYNIVFSSGVVDLTGMPQLTENTEIEVNCIFSTGTLIVSKDQPVVIKGTAAFGTVNTPNGNYVHFGDTFYNTGSATEGTPHLEIEANAVFGTLNIVTK